MVRTATQDLSIALAIWLGRQTTRKYIVISYIKQYCNILKEDAIKLQRHVMTRAFAPTQQIEDAHSLAKKVIMIIHISYLRWNNACRLYCPVEKS